MQSRLKHSEMFDWEFQFCYANRHGSNHRFRQTETIAEVVTRRKKRTEKYVSNGTTTTTTPMMSGKHPIMIHINLNKVKFTQYGLTEFRRYDG